MGEGRGLALRWLVVMVLLAGLALVLDAAAPFAQHVGPPGQNMGAGPTAVPSAGRYTEIRGFLDWFQRGGAFMYPLLISSIIGLAFIIERMISVRRATAHTRRIVAGVLQSLQAEGIGAARERCRAVGRPAARILDTGLAWAHEGPHRAEMAMEASGSIEVALLQRGLLWLSTIANVPAWWPGGSRRR
jgi:hypothetical protein